MSRVFVENINEGTHMADLRCGEVGCTYTAAGVNVNTHAQVKYNEVIEGVTINGNILGTHTNVAALPVASGASVDDLRHVVSDDANGEIPAGGASIYRCVNPGGGNEWQRVQSEISVTCPTCGMISIYPMYDPRNICGTSLGRSKDAGAA